MVTPPPSGEQFRISAGGHTATIVEVGGGVREYAAAGVPVLHPYAEDAMCDGAHGTPLIPWPNRLASGRYTFDGDQHQTAITEPTKNNAIHGLLRWRPWQATEHSPGQVVMSARLHPSKGYPFMLDVAVEYTVGPDGLRAQTTATNIGENACPYACGQHPYLSPGDSLIDDCTLQLDATKRILTDERQLPIGCEDVADTDFDFRSATRIGDVHIDHAFDNLVRDAAGRAWMRLGRPDGSTVSLWVDQSYRLLQVYTADTLAPDRRRRGLGAEPMSAPPNAFATGESLIVLQPGESTTHTWGARLN